jgi:hypothetical protein
MTISDQSKAAPLIERVKNIILTPDSEWEKIDGERTSIQKLYTDYAAILAAIPALAGALGGLIFGYGAMGYHVRLSIGGAIANAVTSYVMALVGVAIVALIIEALAPTFGATKDRLQAFKVAIYSYTAAWLAGIFSLVPPLSILGFVGLYSLYLLYRGLPRLMKAPEDKALAYTAVVVVAVIVVMLALGFLLAPFLHMGVRGGMGPGEMGGMMGQGG